MCQKALTELVYNQFVYVTLPKIPLNENIYFNNITCNMSVPASPQKKSETWENSVDDSCASDCKDNEEDSINDKTVMPSSNCDVSIDISDLENPSSFDVNLDNDNADHMNDNTEPCNDNTEPCNDNTEPCNDNTEPSNDDAKCSNDDTKPFNNNTEHSNDDTKHSNDNTERVNDCFDNLNDNIEHTNDSIEEANPEIVTDFSQSSEKEEMKSEEINFIEKKNEFERVLAQCRKKLETLGTLESLGKDNSNLRHEVSDLKVKLSQQEIEYKKQESKLKSEFLAKIEKLSKECNTLRKEKEAIVIRYANSEKEVINDKKVQQELEKKIKDMTKDRENLLLKLKNACSENSRLSSSVENKMVEIAKLQKENEKLNADFNSREIRIKWLQNKLKTEVTSHQETQVKLDHTLQRLNEMREEAEQVRKDCQEMIKCYQEAEEIKSVKLDGQLKQKLTELEVEKQEKCDQEQVYILLRQELDALKKKQRLTMEDNNALTLKINSLEKERLEYEQTTCKLKDNQNLLKEEIADLTSKLAEMEGLKLLVEQEREKSAASLREVERLRLTNAELQSDLDACHVKEGDRLDFVEKLTAKTMLLQSDHCLLEVKAQAFEDEVIQLKKSISEIEQNYSKLVVEYEDAKKEHKDEMQLLVQKLAEKAKTVEKLNTHLDESENENRVLKRRHIASIKELSRELSQCKRRLESYESNCGIRAESVSLGSRTSSSASLHISNSNDLRQTATSPSVTFSSKKDTPSHEGKNGSSENQFTVDKEVLIERIINLQKMLAKKTDKIDFLEDHIEHLVKEMRKKSKSVDFKNV